MFKGTRFATCGVRDGIPSFLQNIIWYLIETMEIGEKDYLQVFQLSAIVVGGRRMQQIIHSQEQPEYREEYMFNAKHPVSAKIYIIDDKTYCTMLLAEEY